MSTQFRSVLFCYFAFVDGFSFVSGSTMIYDSRPECVRPGSSLAPSLEGLHSFIFTLMKSSLLHHLVKCLTYSSFCS